MNVYNYGFFVTKDRFTEVRVILTGVTEIMQTDSIPNGLNVWWSHNAVSSGVTVVVAGVNEFEIEKIRRRLIDRMHEWVHHDMAEMIGPIEAHRYSHVAPATNRCWTTLYDLLPWHREQRGSGVVLKEDGVDVFVHETRFGEYHSANLVDPLVAAVVVGADDAVETFKEAMDALQMPGAYIRS